MLRTIAEPFQFPKNDRLTVRAQLARDGQGRHVATLRCFAQKDGDPRPTTEGLSVRGDLLPQLKQAVDALLEEHNAALAAAR
jgi:hypothetical protein